MTCVQLGASSSLSTELVHVIMWSSFCGWQQGSVLGKNNPEAPPPLLPPILGLSLFNDLNTEYEYA